MEAVGAYEAKTHLSQLLDRVARGERIAILRHGVPVAILQPIDRAKDRPAEEIVGQIKRFRSGRRLKGLSIRAMIEEGRR